MKVLVTGAAGFIGSHTVDRLLAQGHTVLGVDNLRTGHEANLAVARGAAAFRFERLDVLADGFDALVGDFRPDALIHLAALVSVPESIEQPEENFRLNVGATDRVARCALRWQVPRLVFASSAAVYGVDSETAWREDAPCAPRSPYGAAKLAAENLLLGYARCFGLTVRCQRYFNVFGPRQDPRSPYSGVISLLADRARSGQPFTVHGDGGQMRDFIAVADVAEANVLAATTAGVASGVANICTGYRLSLNELIATFERISGRRLERCTGPVRPGDIRASRGSPEAAHCELGFAARVTLEDGLQDYWRSLLAREEAR